MIISKTKLFAIAILFTATTAIAVPTNMCGCPTQKANFETCNATVIDKEKSPTWWNWLTNNKSSQFHFFQLMELLHHNDTKDTSASVEHDDSDKRAA